MVVTQHNPETNEQELVRVNPFKLKKEEGSKLYFELKSTPSQSGNLQLGFRVYPENKELPHRMDFAYVRWISF